MTASKGLYAPRSSSPGERLMLRVTKTPTCWLWTGAKCFYGYGQLRSKRGGRMEMPAPESSVNFTDAEIVIEPLHQTRRWSSCNYRVGKVELFHERTYVRTRPVYASRRPPTPAEAAWLAGGPSLDDSTEQWLDVYGTEPEMRQIAERLGGTAHAIEAFYHDTPEGEPAPHFLAFRNTDEALAFCRTPAFDRFALTLEKLP